MRISIRGVVLGGALLGAMSTAGGALAMPGAPSPGAGLPVETVDYACGRGWRMNSWGHCVRNHWAPPPRYGWGAPPPVWGWGAPPPRHYHHRHNYW